jgi:hypothetical protein
MASIFASLIKQQVFEIRQPALGVFASGDRGLWRVISDQPLWVVNSPVRFGAPASRSGHQMLLDKLGNRRGVGLGQIVVPAANDLKVGVRKKGQ